MTTITEDYCDFEIAKLLKKKGFDIPCNCYGAYNGVNLTYRLCITDKYTNWNKHTDKFIISCPTLQMAMRWLSEKHNLFIQITVDFSDGAYPMYDVCVIDLAKCTSIVINGYNRYSYEEAIKAGIKYCLENLI